MLVVYYIFLIVERKSYKVTFILQSSMSVTRIKYKIIDNNSTIKHYLKMENYLFNKENIISCIMILKYFNFKNNIRGSSHKFDNHMYTTQHSISTHILKCIYVISVNVYCQFPKNICPSFKFSYVIISKLS